MLYRGTSLTAANAAEFGIGKTTGFEANIYSGRLDTETPNAHRPRGMPIDELPWWTPDETVEKGYLTETQGVVGGITPNLGTAIQFSEGIPIVLYLDESAASPARVSYNYQWFDSMPGALAWVAGGQVDGEIRTHDEGLVGLSTTGENDQPLVHSWSQDDMQSKSVQYVDEREWLVFDESVDVSGAIEAVATVIESSRGPKSVLAGMDGYHAGYRDYPDKVDVSEYSDREALLQIHTEISDQFATPIDNYWVVLLSSRLLEGFESVPADTFEVACDGQRCVTEVSDLPGYLLG